MLRLFAANDRSQSSVTPHPAVGGNPAEAGGTEEPPATSELFDS